MAEREAVDRIEKIGLSHAVFTHKTVELRGKIKVSLEYIAIVLDEQMFK